MKDEGQRHAIASNPDNEQDFIESNIKIYLIALGFICGLITFILYVSMQLTKKIMRRMERINTVINAHCFILSLLSLCLYYLVELTVNFDGVNSSPVIRNQMPWHYHSKFLLLSAFLILICLSSFLGSFLEI